MILLLALLTCCWNFCICALSDPSDTLQVARRTQRDLTVNQTIDQLTFTGMNLNKVIWDSRGYRGSTLDSMTTYLDKGVNVLVMDIYWNENWHNWQFCPMAFKPNVTNYDAVERMGVYECQLGFNLSVVFNSLSKYLRDTNNELNVNIMELFLNVKSIDSEYNYLDDQSNNTITNIITQHLSNLYTPKDLEDDIESGAVRKGEMPTLDHFLYKRYKRVVPIVLSNELKPNSSYGNLTNIDGDTLFVNGYHLNVSSINDNNNDNLWNSLSINPKTTTDLVGALTNLSNEKFRMVMEDNKNDSNISSIENYLLDGFSPILSTTTSSSSVTLSIGKLWSWIGGQPDSGSPLSNTHGNLTNANKNQVADRCAVYYQNGWVVDNCYNKRFVACQNMTSVFDWKLSEEEQTYFGANCPDGFVVGVPQSSLENLAMTMVIERARITTPVWIDMNSITVEGCWVSGGPNAACPYRTLVTKKLFVGMITPAAVVLFILIVLIIALKFDNTPIQQNRKHWKKLINEFNEHDYEGVPS